MKKPSKSLVLAVLIIVVGCFVLLYVGHRYIGPAPVPGPVIPEGSHAVIGIRDSRYQAPFVLIKIGDMESIARLRDAINADYRDGSLSPRTLGFRAWIIAFFYGDGQISVHRIFRKSKDYLKDDSERQYDATRTIAVLGSLFVEGKVSVIDWDEAIKFTPDFLNEKEWIEADEREYEGMRRREAKADKPRDSTSYAPAPATEPVDEAE